MKSQKRLSRETPHRTQPNRSFGKLFDQADGPESTSRAPNGDSHRDWSDPNHSTESDRSLSDTAIESVSLGYQVIEEQIRLGKKAAGKINNQAYNFGNIGGDGQLMFKRIFDSYVELATMSFGFIEQFSKDFVSPQNNANGSSGYGGNSGVEESFTHTNTNRAISVSIRVDSVNPTTVNLNLHAESGDLSVSGLSDLDQGKPVISEVEFIRNLEGTSLLNISVPDDQPSGKYHGVVTDASGSTPLGTLTVVVENREAL